MKTIEAVLFSILIFYVPKASAEASPKLSNYFAEKILAMDDAMNAPSSDQNAPFFLQDINVDVTPSVTIGVNTVLSLSVTPEIDMVFVPQGQEE